MLLPVIRQAADHCGSVAALGRALGITHSAFYRWSEVPAKRVLQIERATGISRHDLRPDLYPREERRAG